MQLQTHRDRQSRDLLVSSLFSHPCSFLPLSPPVTPATQAIGTRSALAVPLLGNELAIGIVLVGRFEVQPFTAEQIVVLQTFADQAVIAIENVRLFTELNERNA